MKHSVGITESNLKILFIRIHSYFHLSSELKFIWYVVTLYPSWEWKDFFKEFFVFHNGIKITRKKTQYFQSSYHLDDHSLYAFPFLLFLIYFFFLFSTHILNHGSLLTLSIPLNCQTALFSLLPFIFQFRFGVQLRLIFINMNSELQTSTQIQTQRIADLSFFVLSLHII